MQGQSPTGTLTQRGRERKILIQLCSGFDGSWKGSTPCLASNAAQSRQGGRGVKEIQTDSHQLVLKPSQEFALAAARQLPWGFNHPPMQQNVYSDLLIRPVRVG